MKTLACTAIQDAMPGMLMIKRKIQIQQTQNRPVPFAHQQPELWLEALMLMSKPLQRKGTIFTYSIQTQQKFLILNHQRSDWLTSVTQLFQHLQYRNIKRFYFILAASLLHICMFSTPTVIIVLPQLKCLCVKY